MVSSPSPTSISISSRRTPGSSTSNSHASSVSSTSTNGVQLCRGHPPPGAPSKNRLTMRFHRSSNSRNGSASVEADRPRLDRVDPQVSAAPRISAKDRPDGLLGLRLDGEHDAHVVEWTAQHDGAFVDQKIHVGRMRDPFGLFFHRPGNVPPGAGMGKLNEKHDPVLPPWSDRFGWLVSAAFGGRHVGP